MNIKHGPFNRVDKKYIIPIKNECNITVLLLSLIDTDVTVLDNNSLSRYNLE